MSTWTIVLAAGSGQRFGGSKQFEPLGERPMVEWTVGAARPACDGMVVVLPEHHRWTGPAVDGVAAGGATHGDSVRAGLDVTPPSADIVVVATASHPLATTSLYTAVIDEVRSGADAAAPVVTSADAIKRVRDGRITESLDKRELRIVQAPSAFRADLLRQVLARPDDAPEELELVERAGGTVTTVPGEAHNIHVATPADLAIARRLVPLP